MKYGVNITKNISVINALFVRFHKKDYSFVILEFFYSNKGEKRGTSEGGTSKLIKILVEKLGAFPEGRK